MVDKHTQAKGPDPSPDLTPHGLRAEIDQGVGVLVDLARRLREEDHTALLEYLQQQLFVLGAQIGEGLDDLEGADTNGDGALAEDEPTP